MTRIEIEKLKLSSNVVENDIEFSISINGISHVSINVIMPKVYCSIQVHSDYLNSALSDKQLSI